MTARERPDDDVLPQVVREEIVRVQSDFQERWEAGLPPGLAECLAGRSAMEQALLLAPLLETELKYRLQKGERPAAADYREQFPECQDVIERTFRKMQACRETPPDRQPIQTIAYTPTVSALRDGARATHSTSGGQSGDARGQVPAGHPARIGRYRVDGILGRGAFGTVYLARDQELRRTVAIKVPRRFRATTDREIEAAVKEARVVASLDHPSIVPVYDVQRTEDGLFYVVSKRIQGSDLAKRLEKGRLGVREAVAIVRQVAEALDHAHQKGLVHRDVKPANTLLDRQGNVYVADFGLAWTREDAQTGEFFAGTPAYMSPEQARGERSLDARSDIFSVGAMFYELLTGQRPFQGSNMTEVISKVLTSQPVPPQYLDSKIPKELSRICLKCLSDRPEGRYASAHELAAALRRWERDTSAEAALEVKASLEASQGLFSTRFQPFQRKDEKLYVGLMNRGRGGQEWPSEVQFWIERINAADPRRRLQVGLMVGPPGAGKSSLVQAGLLPALSEPVTLIGEPVVSIYVEASEHAEDSLLEALRPHVAESNGKLSLTEVCRRLTEQDSASSAGRLLVVLDQFERWLLAHSSAAANSELVEMLRCCDGRRLQCLLIVRDKFQTAARELLQATGKATDLDRDLFILGPLSVERAKHILHWMGSTYRCLPDEEAGLSSDQLRFLEQASRGLAENGTVPLLPLVQFGTIMLERGDWRPSLFSQVGGVSGSLALLLEERFAESGPESQGTAAAARAMLAQLLGPDGTANEAHARTAQELAKAAGYSESIGDFEMLVSILDGELRVIQAVPASSQESPENGEAPAPESGLDHAYRLTNEIWRDVIAQWLSRKPGAGRKRGERRDAGIDVPGSRSLDYVAGFGMFVLTGLSLVILITFGSAIPMQTNFNQPLVKWFAGAGGSFMATLGFGMPWLAIGLASLAAFATGKKAAGAESFRDSSGVLLRTLWSGAVGGITGVTVEAIFCALVRSKMPYMDPVYDSPGRTMVQVAGVLGALTGAIAAGIRCYRLRHFPTDGHMWTGIDRRKMGTALGIGSGLAAVAAIYCHAGLTYWAFYPVVAYLGALMGVLGDGVMIASPAGFGALWRRLWDRRSKAEQIPDSELRQETREAAGLSPDDDRYWVAVLHGARPRSARDQRRPALDLDAPGVGGQSRAENSETSRVFRRSWASRRHRRYMDPAYTKVGLAGLAIIGIVFGLLMWLGR